MRALGTSMFCLLVVATGTAGCGGGVAGPLSGKTPSQVLSTAVAAAERQPSMHYLLQAANGANKQTIEGDATRTGGLQTITANGVDSVTIEVIGTSAYLQGNAGGLQNIMQLSAANSAKYAGKWISVASTDSLYQPITVTVTISGVLNQLVPKGGLVVQSQKTVNGHVTLPVKGGLPGSTASGTTSASATLFVDTVAPDLPVAFQASVTQSGHTVTDQGSFSHWGESITVTPPVGAVPYSSLPTS